MTASLNSDRMTRKLVTTILHFMSKLKKKKTQKKIQNERRIEEFDKKLERELVHFVLCTVLTRRFLRRGKLADPL